jgi:hypothetical protein
MSKPKDKSQHKPSGRSFLLAYFLLGSSLGSGIPLLMREIRDRFSFSNHKSSVELQSESSSLLETQELQSKKPIIWVETQEREFGTVDNPVYSLKETSLDEKITALNKFSLPMSGESLESFREGLDKTRRLFKENVKSYEKLADKLDKKPEYDSMIMNLLDQKISLSRMLSFLSTTSAKIYKDDNKKFILSCSVGSNRLKRSISEESLVRQLFAEITGKPFPEKVDINKKEIKKGMANYRPYTRKISYKDFNYATNLYSLLHECGHVCSQHDEQIRIKEIRSMQYIKYKGSYASILEEACAYAFLDTATHVIGKNDRELAEMLKLKLEVDIYFFQEKLYKEPEKYREEHHTGAELFVAARKVLKDPVKVFNYLATLKDSNFYSLDPKIKVQLHENRWQWQSWMKLHRDIETLRGKAESLNRQHEQLKTKIKEFNQTPTETKEIILTPQIE